MPVEHGSIGGRAVRQGRLRAGQAGDIERKRLRTIGPHRPFETQCQVGLGHAGRDVGQQPSQRAIGDGACSGDPLQFGRLLDRPVGLDPAVDRDQLDVGCRSRQLLPRRVWHEACLDRDAFRADRGDELRPAAHKVAVDDLHPRVGRLAPGLDRVARVREKHEVVAGQQELARRPGRLLLPLGEREARQVADVLPSDAEVGIDARVREPGSETGDSGRAGDTVGLVPAVALSRRRRGGEVGGTRPRGASQRHVYPYFFLFASCCLAVLAKTCLPLSSGMARK